MYIIFIGLFEKLCKRYSGHPAEGSEARFPAFHKETAIGVSGVFSGLKISNTVLKWYTALKLRGGCEIHF